MRDNFMEKNTVMDFLFNVILIQKCIGICVLYNRYMKERRCRNQRNAMSLCLLRQNHTPTFLHMNLDAHFANQFPVAIFALELFGGRVSVQSAFENMSGAVFHIAEGLLAFRAFVWPDAEMPEHMGTVLVLRKRVLFSIS